MFGNYNKKYGYQQQQKQKQITAHEMELVIDTFHNTLEALEEYIGKAGYYSDWDSKRQIYRKSIADSNDTTEGFEDLFLTQLFIVKASVNKKPEFFRKEVQKEYKKWVSAAGISVNNCPEKLKNYLFTINEILEGRGEEFVNQTRELIKDVKLTPQDSLKFFSELQEPLNKNDERGKLLESKKWNQVDNERKLSGGNIEQGEESLDKIIKSTSSSEISFYDSDYYRKQGGSNSPQSLNNFQIIQDVIQNPQNWRIDEIITRYSNFGKNKEETVLIHRNARLEDYNQQTGELNFNSNPVYKKEKFSNEEWNQIESAVLGVSQTSTNQAVRWDLVNKINQQKNRFKVEKVVVFNEKNNDFVEEWWIIHDLAERKDNGMGGLVFDSRNMFKVNDLTESEKQAIGYNKSEISSQNISSVSEIRKDNKLGTGGVLAIVGIVSVLIIVSVVMVRKRLKGKIK